MFYDDDWRKLVRKDPLIAKKIEEVRCDCVAYEEFERLARRVEVLEQRVKVLLELNGLATKKVTA